MGMLIFIIASPAAGSKTIILILTPYNISKDRKAKDNCMQLQLPEWVCLGCHDPDVQVMRSDRIVEANILGLTENQME